jgi:hypothetical protein
MAKFTFSAVCASLSSIGVPGSLARRWPKLAVTKPPLMAIRL